MLSQCRLRNNYLDQKKEYQSKLLVLERQVKHLSDANINFVQENNEVQNQLKEATSSILRSLSEEGHLKVRMATGDNIMTAVCVGRKSNLIEPNAVVYS